MQVFTLPTVWPDVSLLGADDLRRVAGYDFHLLRKKYDVRSMWGDLKPHWRLLKSQLETSIRSLSENSGFFLTGRIGLVMIRKMTLLFFAPCC